MDFRLTLYGGTTKLLIPFWKINIFKYVPNNGRHGTTLLWKSNPWIFLAYNVESSSQFLNANSGTLVSSLRI
jgi:hypothetical protein